MALARLSEELMKRDWLERFIQIGTSEMYGSVDHAATEEEPIKPSSPYAASKVAFDMYLLSVHVPEIPDEHPAAVERLLPGAAAAPRRPKGDLCGLIGEKLPLQAAARLKNPTFMRAISAARFISSPEGAARHGI